MPETELIPVEVAYAEPAMQALIGLYVPVGTSLREAIELSGVRQQFPGMEVDPARVGIFGVKATLEDILRPGDRVEIYRPLLADPKEARRKRARLQKPGN